MGERMPLCGRLSLAQRVRCKLRHRRGGVQPGRARGTAAAEHHGRACGRATCVCGYRNIPTQASHVPRGLALVEIGLVRR